MENSHCELFFNTPVFCSNSDDLIKEFDFEDLREIKEIFKNNFLRVFSAELNNESENFFNQKVILLEISLITLEEISVSNVKSSLFSSQYIIRENSDFHYFYFKRLGFSKNFSTNTIFFIYFDNGNRPIDLLKIYRENENPKLLLLSYFNKLLELYEKHYSIGSNFLLLHPNLIFESQICGFQQLDYLFGEISKKFKFDVNNFAIANYFGILDFDVLQEINFENDKKIYRNAQDIILLSLFLAYLFSVDIKNIQNLDQEKVKSIYSILVFKLRGEFNCKNSSFQHFLENIKDEEAKVFLRKVLNLNYKEIVSIYKFRELFNSLLFDSNMQNEKCVNSRKNDNSACTSVCANKMNFICKHFLCSDCYKTHVKCEKFSPEKLIFVKDLERITSERFNSLEIQRELSPDTSSQYFVKYFEKYVKENFLKIEIDQEKMARYTTMIDEKLNHMINYIEKLIRTAENSKKEQLKRLIKDVESEVYTIRVKFEKKLITLKKSSGSILKVETPRLYDPRDEKVIKLIDNPSAIKILEKEKRAKLASTQNLAPSKFQNYYENYADFESYLWVFSDFIEKVRTNKHLLNITVNQDTPFVDLSKQNNEYFKEITSEFNSEFSNLCKKFEDELYSFHSRAELYDTPENNILDLYKTKENKMLVALDSLKDLLYIYNMKDNADAKFKLNFSEDYGPEPKKILKHSKWVNLGGRMIVTGGLWKKENREVCTNKAFYISFYESVSENKDVRDVTQVADMLQEREQHTLVQVNCFYVAAIGGTNSLSCEMFNILKNEWKHFAKLPYPIKNASAVLYNQTNLYLFFGLKYTNMKNKDPEFSSDVMLFRLFSDCEDWETVQYHSSSNTSLCDFAILSWADSSIFIVGGKTSFEIGVEANSRQILEFDPQQNKFEVSKYSLPKPALFFESNFISVGNNEFGLYSVDYHVCRLKV